MVKNKSFDVFSSQEFFSSSCRVWRKDMLQRLPLIKASLSDEKQTLGSVKTEFKDYQNKMAAINKKITGVIQKVCKKEKQGGCMPLQFFTSQ